MYAESIPKYVPLPEVPEYTDDVVFGNLRLPQGFDEDRLLVNLGAFRRTQKAAGLGRIIVHVETGKDLDHALAISGVDDNGTATVGATARQEKRRIADSKIDFPYKASRQGNPTVNLSIDSAVLDKAIEKKNHGNPVIVRNPALRAQAMNSAVSIGLERAARSANFDPSGIITTGLFTSQLAYLSILLGGNATTAVEAVLFGHPAIKAGAYAILAVILQRKGLPVNQVLGKTRPSIVMGASIDRYLAGATVISTSKFIKAAK